MLRRLFNRLRAYRRLVFSFLVVATAMSCGSAPAREDRQNPAREVIHIWSGQPSGSETWLGPEQEADAELPNIGKVHVITNVTVPTLTIFRPPVGKANGTAIVVVPGGAFRALPWDLDGTEPAQWLVDRGITAFVLKYRVRPPPSSEASADQSFDGFADRTEPARNIAVADAEQAMRVVRSRAKHFGIAANRVGMIGFSAGAMTAMSVALSGDSAVRPNFAVSLYGALLEKQAPPSDAPPLFIVAAQDDPQAPALRSVEIFRRWSEGNHPAELHLYERGGHGFGFRRRHLPTDSWTEAFEAWLTLHGYIRAAGR